MEVESINKGLLPPRVQLISGTDRVTIPFPATGLVVYHTGISTMDAGIYVNMGTTTNPSWIKGGQPVDDTLDSQVYKIKYVGRNTDKQGFPKPTLKVVDLNLEFRFAENDTAHSLQIRLITIPSQTVMVKSVGHIHGAVHPSGNNTLIFTVAHYNVWQDIGPKNEWWAYFYYIITNDTNSLNKACAFYALTSYGNQSAVITQEPYYLAAEVYWFSDYRHLELANQIADMGFLC